MPPHFARLAALVLLVPLLASCAGSEPMPGRVGPGGGKAVTGTGTAPRAESAPAAPAPAPAPAGPAPAPAPGGTAGGYRILSQGQLSGAVLPSSAVAFGFRPGSASALGTDFCGANPSSLLRSDILFRRDGVEASAAHAGPGMTVVTTLGQSSTVDRANIVFDGVYNLLDICGRFEVDGTGVEVTPVPVRSSGSRSGGVTATGTVGGSRVGFAYVYAQVGPVVAVVATRSAGAPDVAFATRVLEAQLSAYRSAAS